MSDNNNVQFEFGGQVAPSYDSSVEHVKTGLREQAVEYGKLAGEVAASATSAYAVHKAKASAIQAAWSVASATTREAFGAMAAKGVSAGVSIAEGFVRVLPALARVSGGMALVSVGTTVLTGAMRVLRAASDEVDEGLSKFADQEDLVSKLKPLTGSVDLAKDKLRELASFAKGTKLETPEVVGAYRSTQVKTGGALSDKKGLTMLGDVGAASGNGLKDTADAVGELYGDLQAGAPINDATEKLKEMGIVSAEVTQRIYTLQSEGKSGAEVWAYLAGQLDKSSGAMKAAADNLTTLQKSLVDAKNRLHELFAEASVGGQTAGGEDDGLKGKIKGQIATLEALEPAAREAGRVYASFRSVASDAVQYVADKLGLTKKATDDNSDSVLRHVGSLRTWVDVLTVAGAAVVGVAATLVGFGTALTASGVATLGLHAALATGSASAILGASALSGLLAAAIPLVAVFGTVATVVLSAGVAYRVYADHAIEADKRLASLIDSNKTMLVSLHQQEQGIKSVTDKILFLAKAYQELDAVQTKLAKTKDPRQREELERAEQRVRNDIARADKLDDDKLKPGEARDKSQKATKDAQDATDDLLDDPKKKYDAALSDMEEARKKQYELREKLAAAQKAAGPGGEASDAVVEPQIAAARQRIEESQRRQRDAEHMLPRSYGEANEGYQKEIADAKAAQEVERQKIRDLQGFRAGREQRVENARGELAAQDTVVAQSGTNLAKTGKANDEYQAKLRQLEIEKQIAALDTEGLARAREEWQLKRAGLEADLAALHGTDQSKSGEIETKIAQGDALLKKQQEEAEARARELEIEAQIAGLKTEGIQRARDEWAIRRAGLETELAAARKHGDIGKENEIVTKIVQGDAGLQKDERKNTDSESEVEAEAQIASLQTEGIQRAREESDIRLRIIEGRWREAAAAKDTLAADKARLDYIKEQQAQKKREEDNRHTNDDDTHGYYEAVAKRQEDAAKREIERQFKDGKITDDERRQQEAGILARQQARTNDEADRKERQADEAQKVQDTEKALRLRREAEDLRGRGDALKDEQYDLLHPDQQHQTAAADSLQKVGGGGNVFYGGGRNPLEAKLDRQIKATEDVAASLKRIEDRRGGGSAFQ